MMELPGISLISKPLYRQYFRRPYRQGNIYYGIYSDYDAALKQACRLASDLIPPTYDVDQASIMYRSQLTSLRACDYPALHWVQRILAEGGRAVFDLGGHIGVAYYGFERYIDYPLGTSWTVNDLPIVTAAGRALANRRDTFGRLHFADSPAAANGADLLICTGALQYLDYSLTELLDQLVDRPRHVLLNLTPLHPDRAFFTLQNLGIAICPYRVESRRELVIAMQDRGYRIWDEWRLSERQLKVPFEPDYDVDYYQGIYFVRD